MNEKQIQRGGPDSNQTQVGRDQIVIHTGITEERARTVAAEVATEIARKTIEDYTHGAQELGAIRIAQFDEILIGYMLRHGQLGAFTDPSFQILLRKAQIGAASSEREDDYDMLAGLLSDRVARGDDRQVRVGITRAVEVVEQMDEVALTGLTVFSAAQQFGPNANTLPAALTTMETLYGQLVDGRELPTGSDWVDHLDLLDAIRLSQIGTLKKFEVIQAGVNFVGFVARGVEIGSDEEAAGTLRFEEFDISPTLIEHELRPGYLRAHYVRPDVLQKIAAAHFKSEETADRMVAICKEVYGFGEPDETLIPLLADEMTKYPNLARVREWWNQIPASPALTSVGRVLATANAKRLDYAKILPPLD